MAFLDSPNGKNPFQYIIGGSQDPMLKYGRPKMSDPNYDATADETNARQKFDEAQTYQTGLANQAKTYRQNLPGTQGELFNQASDVGKRGLAQSIAQTRSSASSRGLLNSGIRQGAESNNYGNYLSGLSSSRAGINKETEANAQGMENSAVQAGTNLQQQRQAMEDAIYSRQMQQYENATKQREADKGLLGGLGSSVGGAFGSYMGSKSGGK